MTPNSPVAFGGFALTRGSPRHCSLAREASRHMVNPPPPLPHTKAARNLYLVAFCFVKSMSYRAIAYFFHVYLSQSFDRIPFDSSTGSLEFC